MMTMSVCLSASISPEPHDRSSPDFVVHIRPTSVRDSVHLCGAAIRCVLPSVGVPGFGVIHVLLHLTVQRNTTDL